MKLYVAGPMTGHVGFNLPEFERVTALLDAAGFAAHNPGHRGVIRGYEWRDYMRDSLRMLLGCDGVALLDGWSRSRGVQVEVHVARALSMPVEPYAAWLRRGVAA